MESCAFSRNLFRDYGDGAVALWISAGTDYLRSGPLSDSCGHIFYLRILFLLQPQTNSDANPADTAR